MSVTANLSEFVNTLAFDDLPQTCIERIKFAILDTLGCVVLGSKTEVGKTLVRYARHLGAQPEATILTTSVRTSSPYASFVNGTMGHEFDYDDGVSTALGVHTGITIVPAALAIGEREEVTGKELLTAVVAGYEVACRVGRAIERVSRVSTLTGAFGATAAGARLLNLDSEQTANAFGICGSLIPLRPFGPALKGVMVKDMWGGVANMFGLQCALLAKEGITGPIDILEPEGDFYKIVVRSGTIKKEALTDDLGKKFLWMDGHYFKPYPSCRGTHVTLDAVLKLRRENDFDYREIEEIMVVGRDIVSILKGVFNSISARFSTPYVVAAAMKYGRLTLEEFNERVLNDKETLELAGKVKTAIDPDIPEWPHGHGPVEVIVKFREGTSLSATAKDDRSLDYEGVISKFNQNCTEKIGEERTHDVIKAIRRIEKVNDVRAMVDLLSS